MEPTVQVKMKNRLILIGFNNGFIAYLNVAMNEALKRYEESEKRVPNMALIETIEFDDCFGVYNRFELNPGNS